MKPGSHGESSAKNKLDSIFLERLFFYLQKKKDLISDEKFLL